MRTIGGLSLGADIVPAAVVLVVSLVPLLNAEQAYRPFLPWGLVLTLACCALLLVRRRWPVWVFALTTAVTITYYTLGFADTAMGAGMVVALYTVATKRRWWVSLVVGICAVAGFVLAAPILRGYLPGGAFLLQVVSGVGLMLALTVAVGEVVKARQLAADSAEQRAAEALRASEEHAQRRATEERLRIARELHDVLAHQLSLINVQASAALHRFDPDRAEPTLRAVKDASGSALRELRGLLGVLRRVDEATAPVPTLARLDDLVASARASGLEVSVSGTVPDLDAGVSATGYRIVQESLTNVVRHARAGTATVDIRACGPTVRVRVADDGAGDVAGDGATDGTGGDGAEGNGLRGMRERVAAVGGSMTAGPRSGGGFEVCAELPSGAGLQSGTGAAAS